MISLHMAWWIMHRRSLRSLLRKGSSLELPGTQPICSLGIRTSSLRADNDYESRYRTYSMSKGGTECMISPRACELERMDIGTKG